MGRFLAWMLFCTVPVRAASWLHMSSPSAEVFTDCGERTARAVLNRFEMLRRVFRESSTGESPAPVKVFVFASLGEFEKYRPRPNTTGSYEPSGDQDFILLYESEALKRTASHEYLHMVMNHSSAKLPAWLEEGIPEFYSTVSVSATKVRVGGEIEPHLRLLAFEPWLSAEDLALGSPADGRIFYAESWALVHMLSLQPPWAGKLPGFIKLLSAGRDPDDAFLEAFGKSMEDAVAALHSYVRITKEATDVAPPAEEATLSPATKLTPVDAALALARMALHTDHPRIALSLYARAAKENPQSPAAVAGLGELALAERREQDAQHEFERAIAMGYRDAETYFQLALLKNDKTLLEQTLTVDPNFAEAHFLLGVRATDRGDFPAAVDYLRHAVAIKPRRFSYWNALGYAQAKAGDRAGASESARRATQIASGDQEEKMAASLTELASQASSEAAPKTKRPDVITPPSWQNRKGDTRVEGTLKRVDCDAVPVRLIVSPADAHGDIELRIQHPGSVVLTNAEGKSTNLTCGDQATPIVVEYIAASKEITRIEFKSVVIMKR